MTAASHPPLEPLFIDAGGSRRFALHHTPRDGAPRALAVNVHPFAEEMNKSRRMAAMQARALAAAGWAVLQIDLHGCGDSEGDFGDATWSRWVDDVRLAADWLRARHGSTPPLWLWGLRVGALLAQQAATGLAGGAGLLLWQPTAQGKTALQQFLRLKSAGAIVGGQGGTPVAELRRELAEGRAVEVAGYSIHPALAAGLDAAVLAPPPAGRPVAWIEALAGDGDTIAPAAAAAQQRWRDAGCLLHARAAAGPAFWQTTEIEDAPAWIDATMAALAAAETHPAPAMAA